MGVAKRDWKPVKEPERWDDYPSYPWWQKLKVPVSEIQAWYDPGNQVLAAVSDDESLSKVIAPMADAYTVRTGKKILSECLAEEVDDPEWLTFCVHRALNAMVDSRPRFSGRRPTESADVMGVLMSELATRYSAGEEGIRSHLPGLNRLIGGFRPGQLITVAGFTGGGKTALGVNFLWHCARTGNDVMMLSSEMTTNELAGRMLALESGVSGHRIINSPPDLSRDDWDRIHDAAALLAGWKWEVRDKVFTLEDVQGALRARQMRGTMPKLVVVDYLQRMEVTKRRDSTTREMLMQLTIGLKSAAQEFEVPIVLMAQLNRSAVKDGMPSMFHLAETSQIEKESDICMLIFRTSDDEGLRRIGLEPDPITPGTETTVLKVDKNRNGPIGAIALSWTPKVMLFTELDPLPEEAHWTK